jgi:hypothetical protein
MPNLLTYSHQIPSKWANRFSLGFSITTPILEFKEANVEFIDDIGE